MKESECLNYFNMFAVENKKCWIMNIFKILANGDGTINEPNVSAFLGYLLDPKEEHGLDDILLRKVLQALYDQIDDKARFNDWLVDNKGQVRNLSKNSTFDIEVYFEQAFKKEDHKKQIVDIVILCYEKSSNKGESQIINSISNTRVLKHIFLIENKIKNSTKTEGQLKNQFSSTIDVLRNIVNNQPELIVSTIFITPENDPFDDEFEKFGNPNSIHVYWNSSNRANRTMCKFFKAIIFEELRGKIDPINEYSKQTIKAFITFIENDFQSKINEDLGKTINRDIIYDWDTFKNKYKEKEILSPESWEIAKNFVNECQKKSELAFRHSPTHIVSVFKGDYKNKKILSLSSNGKKLMIRLKGRNGGKSDSDVKHDLASIIDINNVEVKNDEKDFILRFKSMDYLSKKIVLIFEKWLEIHDKY